MLNHVERVQIVVRDREAAAATWGDLFGAEKVGEDGVRYLNAHRTTVQAGVSLFDFLEPAGPGPVAGFAAKWTSGLYGVGFSSMRQQSIEGMLMGVSRTNYAWVWSGRPDLAGAEADAYAAH